MPKPQPPPLGWTTLAKVERVIDGDTLEITITRKVRIRVLDCWAPETHKTGRPGEKDFGLKVKAFVQELIDKHGTDVRVHIPTDVNQALADVLTMGRVLGDIWLADGRSLAAILRKRGMATKTKQELIEQLEGKSP